MGCQDSDSEPWTAAHRQDSPVQTQSLNSAVHAMSSVRCSSMVCVRCQDSNMEPWTVAHRYDGPVQTQSPEFGSAHHVQQQSNVVAEHACRKLEISNVWLPPKK